MPAQFVRAVRSDPAERDLAVRLRMHHLGIGADHRGTPVLLLADDSTVTVVATRTGEILATNQIDPDKTYWRNTMKAPAAGRRLPTSDL